MTDYNEDYFDVDVSFQDEDDDCENWTYDDFADEKPSWNIAPEWAESLGVCTFGQEKGEWCWFRGARPSYVLFLETRPYEN